MTDYDKKFTKAVEIVQGLPKGGPIKPTQDDQLYFYKYYKQATIGEPDIPRPTGMLDFTGKAKWDAWNSVKDTSKDEAKKLYVEKLKEVLTAVKDTDESAREYLKALEDA